MTKNQMTQNTENNVLLLGQKGATCDVDEMKTPENARSKATQKKAFPYNLFGVNGRKIKVLAVLIAANKK